MLPLHIGQPHWLLERPAAAPVKHHSGAEAEAEAACGRIFARCCNVKLTTQCLGFGAASAPALRAILPVCA